VEGGEEVFDVFGGRPEGPNLRLEKTKPFSGNSLWFRDNMGVGLEAGWK
jgi:hypothetical protein